MNNISDRLKVIADIIGSDASFADIGTDHGYLALLAQKRDNNNKMVLTDISPHSLDKAFNNVTGDNVDFRIGDGLAVIEHSEVDCIVVAGMGGILISLILEADLDKTHSFKKIIVQPRNNSGYLKEWLVSNGFKITDDLLVREGKYICNVIGAEPGDMDNCPETGDILWEVPFESPDKELFTEYVNSLIDREKRIEEGLMQSENDKNEAESVRENIRKLEEILDVKE